MESKNCQCGKQIVWFYESKGSIIACKNCEITFYYTTEKCPYCKEPTTEFKEVLKE